MTLYPITVKANMARDLKPSQRLTNDEVIARTYPDCFHRFRISQLIRPTQKSPLSYSPVLTRQGTKMLILPKPISLTQN